MTDIIEDVVTYEVFSNILSEYGFSEKQIDMIWNSPLRPGKLTKKRLRETAEHFAPIKDQLEQL